jgi:putative phosphoribosyl transferase
VVEEHVTIEPWLLNGDLSIPPAACGMVVLCHGGGGRLNPNNRAMAVHLNRAGFATLLFDWLSSEEAEKDRWSSRRFDIPCLAERVVGVTDWVGGQASISTLGIGYLGASSGAAAAFTASVTCSDKVRAVVSCGGLLDLAGARLPLVRAPSLLIVGTQDEAGLAAHRDATRRMRAPSRIASVAGGSRLFDDPAAIPEVTSLAAAWFARFLPSGPSVPS